MRREISKRNIMKRNIYKWEGEGRRKGGGKERRADSFPTIPNRRRRKRSGWRMRGRILWIGCVNDSTIALRVDGWWLILAYLNHDLCFMMANDGGRLDHDPWFGSMLKKLMAFLQWNLRKKKVIIQQSPHGHHDHGHIGWSSNESPTNHQPWTSQPWLPTASYTWPPPMESAKAPGFWGSASGELSSRGAPRYQLEGCAASPKHQTWQLENSSIDWVSG